MAASAKLPPHALRLSTYAELDEYVRASWKPWSELSRNLSAESYTGRSQSAVGSLGLSLCQSLA